MICPECNGKGEAIYYVETDRDENTVTVKVIKDICRTCNGSGRKPQTNADRIREMSDEDLATHLHNVGWDCHLCAEHSRLENEPLLRGEKCDEKCVEHCLEWLKQPAEQPKEG